jgi:putative redox protein
MMGDVTERVWFASTSGPKLAGLIDPPEGLTRGWGVFSHGFTLGKDCAAASRICKQLASEGIGMLRFDNLGLGDSEGDWGDGSFSHKLADTAQAARYMNDSGREVRLLVGHSFGGATVIGAAHQIDSVRAVVSIGAPYQPGHVEHNYDALVERILADGEAPFLIGGKALTLRRHFLEDVRAADLREQIRTLHRALLCLHSRLSGALGVASVSWATTHSARPMHGSKTPGRSGARTSSATMGQWPSKSWYGEAMPRASTHGWTGTRCGWRPFPGPTPESSTPHGRRRCADVSRGIQAPRAR